MFVVGMSESVAKTRITINEQYNIFLALIQYIYSGKINTGLSNNALDTVDLFRLAKMHGLVELQKKSLAGVKSQMTVENAARVLHKIVREVPNEQLKKVAVDFIREHFLEVSATKEMLALETTLWQEIVSGLRLQK
mmetsp:Transcript_19063/g.52243  ORF Transcript_19063/g.52243 Transcript_19063/m.52243 type:complete len:136 (-) Transcript_19063:1142-1549(-)